MIVIFCVGFWFFCCLFVSVFVRLLDFADSLGFTALDSPFGTEVWFLIFINWLCNVGKLRYCGKTQGRKEILTRLGTSGIL